MKPGAHGKEFAEQSSTNETFVSPVLTVCGQILLKNYSFVAVKKMLIGPEYAGGANKLGAGKLLKMKEAGKPE